MLGEGVKRIKNKSYIHMEVIMKTESITLRITETEKEQLKQIAQKLDVPMSQLIRRAIKEIIQKEGK